MEDATRCRRITNLTELWWNGNHIDLFTENGYTVSGSDYDRLRTYCKCMERMPDTAVAVAHRPLEVFFGFPLRFTADACEDTWKSTSQWLMEHPTYQGDADAVINECDRLLLSAAMALPAMPMGQIRLCDAGLDGMEATCWDAWKAAAEAQMEHCLQAGKVVSICLSPQYEPTKPDLYHINRHLSGAERWDAQWETQKAIFCMRHCAERGLPVMIGGNCEFNTVKRLLSLAARFTPLPELIWRPEQATRSELLDLCRIVAEGRTARREGLPPVLTVAGEISSGVSLPHLTVQILS